MKIKYSPLLTLIILIIGVTLVLFSCKLKIRDTDKLWNPYQKGEQLVFESNLKNIDTIKITDILLQTQPSHWPSSSSKSYEYIEVKANFSFPSNGVNNDNVFIYIGRDVNSTNIEFSISIQDDFYEFYTVKNNILEVDMNPHHGTIKKDNNFFRVSRGQKILKAYKLYNYGVDESMKQFPTRDYNNCIKYVYWNKSKGLIGYEKYNGEIFRLI